MDILEEEIIELNENTRFPEEEEEEFMRSKSGSLFGSRDELNFRSDEEEVATTSHAEHVPAK